jgi:hypothetical protein
LKDCTFNNKQIVYRKILALYLLYLTAHWQLNSSSEGSNPLYRISSHKPSKLDAMAFIG